MPTVKARHIDYQPEDEKLLRRLGGAFALLWETFPEVQREMVVAQASMLADREETTQLHQQLNAFIAKHKVHD